VAAPHDSNRPEGRAFARPCSVDRAACNSVGLPEERQSQYNFRFPGRPEGA
jgi:hypothetical protein